MEKLKTEENSWDWDELNDAFNFINRFSLDLYNCFLKIWKKTLYAKSPPPPIIRHLIVFIHWLYTSHPKLMDGIISLLNTLYFHRHWRILYLYLCRKTLTKDFELHFHNMSRCTTLDSSYVRLIALKGPRTCISTIRYSTVLNSSQNKAWTLLV